QPGNNYRVAASVFVNHNLSALQVANPANALYVSSDGSNVPGFAGEVSPPLTVWRKLHLEIDSMDDMPATVNFVPATIYGYKPNYPKAGQSLIFVNLGEIYRFQTGKVDIGGVGSGYRIIDAGAANEGYPSQWVVINTVPTVDPSYHVAKIRDDDDDYLADMGLPKALPKLSSVSTILSYASPRWYPFFIELDDANANGWNSHQLLPFSLNQEPYSIMTFSTVLDDAQDLTDSRNFWAHLVAFAYQPAAGEDDGDHLPNNPLYGATSKLAYHHFSAVYVETIRDQGWARGTTSIEEGDKPSAQASYWRFLAGCMNHEIAHRPGSGSESSDHAEDGQLSEANIELSGFFEKTIRRIRQINSWSH
ncbi:MAG TPA: hypothetical protein VMB21_17875, partial [Candidatus Limnocylindria bacterium]|nr:hypothetical protein [Candidatus Limnocylindria bacterium]